MQQQQQPKLSFQNQLSYVDETKIMHVLGEVKNESGAAVKGVIITASFYDAQHNLLGQYSDAPKLRIMNPGQSAPFDMRYIDPATVGRVANYTLSAASETAGAAKPVGLEITSSNSRLDVLGVYYINVGVKNVGAQAATNPSVVATLYDKNGRVVAIGEALVEGNDRVTALEPGQEGGSGIVVSDRLQTYKAARYSLVADSDQYLSEVVMLKAAGLGASAGTSSSPPAAANNTGAGSGNSRSGCLIATAAYGSELAPQVQQLRGFRDGIALKTAAGSSFMNVFNAWYYSFSPQVADYERQQPWLQGAVRALIAPLLAVLDASTAVHHSLSGLGLGGEAAVVGAGLTASSLIGLVYLAPVSAVLALMAGKRRMKRTGAGRRQNLAVATAKYALAAAWVASLAGLAAGELGAGTGALMFGTALLVLSALFTVALAAGRLAARGALRL
jgi:peptide/nickel transport system substrate-binding protein